MNASRTEAKANIAEKQNKLWELIDYFHYK